MSMEGKGFRQHTFAVRIVFTITQATSWTGHLLVGVILVSTEQLATVKESWEGQQLVRVKDKA